MENGFPLAHKILAAVPEPLLGPKFWIDLASQALAAVIGATIGALIGATVAFRLERRKASEDRRIQA